MISTPPVADACIRCGVPQRAAPAGIVPVVRGARVMGLALPTRKRAQAQRIRAGETLRDQTASDEYLAQRATDAGYTFRAHLRRIGGAIEE